ncbi:glutathione S-transferase LANCL1-like [Dysidea avara]|uniref:glutathione S-transferase LANCL1-like n=1 Tax=Dysidea avara TaxID=196820 RepID=UPI00331AB0D4
MSHAKKAKKAKDERSYSNPHLDDPMARVTATPAGDYKVPAELRAQLVSTIKGKVPLIDQVYGSPSGKCDESVYTGYAGVAYLHLHLAINMKDESPYGTKKHLERASSILEELCKHPSSRRLTFLCGAAGPLALNAAVQSQLEQDDKAKKMVMDLKNLFPIIKAEPSMPSELLYGHVGYLYALLFVNKYIPGAVEESMIRELVQLVVSVGQANRLYEFHSPLMYSWHNSYYVGAAHGLAGIMTLLMMANVSGLKDQMDLVKMCVDFVDSIQFPSGNYPSSLGRDVDRLIHWCHGAPGVIYMLTTAYETFGDNKYLEKAKQCGEVIWERGLLLKGFGICHGVSGNAYAFLKLYQLTKHPAYLYRACKFAEWCLTGPKPPRDPDSPYSMFEGLAGTVYFFCDLLTPEQAGFPAFELPSVK